MKNKITVSIAGQEYTMVAEEAENYVKRCAELVDAQVRLCRRFRCRYANGSQCRCNRLRSDMGIPTTHGTRRI